MTKKMVHESLSKPVSLVLISTATSYRSVNYFLYLWKLLSKVGKKSIGFCNSIDILKGFYDIFLDVLMQSCSLNLLNKTFYLNKKAFFSKTMFSKK